ncbi:Protein RETICULATA-RELATED 3, chloroplastic [Porphyridium purpureum]|uniref:Protein RETICULATA-RELATED 3, chloroplastic n=1 Tax=Porphyridium purpureum TaxID=35688 RepID=A0A5J4YX07_PORPP|nr:Protein RETICULATA-RELATED 3, chloroplastic [Porphyridium purpureum]|eukprot:POR6918..scf209_3
MDVTAFVGAAPASWTPSLRDRAIDSVEPPRRPRNTAAASYLSANWAVDSNSRARAQHSIERLHGCSAGLPAAHVRRVRRRGRVHSQTGHLPAMRADDGGAGSGSASGGSGGGGDKGDFGHDESHGDIPGLAEIAALMAKHGKNIKDYSEQLLRFGPKHVQDYLEIMENPFVKRICSIWPGFHRRVLGDPEFPFKLLMEETLGVGLAGSGFVAARGMAILDDLDTFFLDMTVGFSLNFILLYLLTPTLGAKTGVLSRLPANAFAKGNFSFGQRVAGYVAKTSVFSLCGLAAGMLGTSAHYGIQYTKLRAARSPAKSKELREKIDALPGVIPNGLGWAAFMVVSAAPRYQLVSGAERALFDSASLPVAKVFCAVIRTINNVVGGSTWVMLSRRLGLSE